MKLKGLHFADIAEIQEAITDELKKVQKEEFLAAFQKLPLCRNLYICQWCLNLNKKEKYVSSILKKSVLKLLYHTVYVYLLLNNWS